MYDLKQTLSEKEINKDLNELITIYKSLERSPLEKKIAPIDVKTTLDQINFNFNSLLTSTILSGLIFSPQLIQRFIGSLFTKPFVILTGLSGSGKTKLALAFVKSIAGARFFNKKHESNCGLY